MSRRSLLRTAKNLPKHWRPLRARLPRLPHPLPFQVAHVAQWFHALSDTTRLDIVELLSQRDRFVTELCRVTDAPQSSIAFHLKVLLDSGVVRSYRDGRRKYYGLREDTMEDLVTFARLLGPGKHVGTCPLTCCRWP